MKEQKSSKAILILDMPKSCEKCSLCYNGIDCAINGWVVFSNEGQTNRSSRCPLKSIPQKKENVIGFDDIDLEWSADSYCEGWNECIEEILGEEE